MPNRIDRIERWVKQNGTKVTFGNLVGIFLGTDYNYICATEQDAISFAKYLSQRDPANDNLPTAVTDEIRALYHAELTQ